MNETAEDEYTPPPPPKPYEFAAAVRVADYIRADRVQGRDKRRALWDERYEDIETALQNADALSPEDRNQALAALKQQYKELWKREEEDFRNEIRNWVEAVYTIEAFAGKLAGEDTTEKEEA